MNENETHMMEIFPVGPNGELTTPPELIGKSIEELKAMGAREVASFDGGDIRFKPMEGGNPAEKAEEREEMRQVLHDLQME